VNSLTQDDVIEVLKIIDESKYDELHLETGDLKLIVRRGSGGSAHVQELTTLKDTSKRLDDGREQVPTQTRTIRKRGGAYTDKSASAWNFLQVTETWCVTFC
jgi:hypothetical protein